MSIENKKIETGTEITFKKTGEIYGLTQTESGFEVKKIKLSKNPECEHYSFQELIDLYESGDITFQNFGEADASLVKSQLLNYIYQSGMKTKIDEVQSITKINETLTTTNEEFTTKNAELSEKNTELTTENEKLKTDNEELVSKNNALNESLEAMKEEPAERFSFTEAPWIDPPSP